MKNLKNKKLIELGIGNIGIVVKLYFLTLLISNNTRGIPFKIAEFRGMFIS